MSSTRLMSFSNRRPDFWGTAVTGVMLLVPVAAVLGLRFVGPWPVVVLLLVCIAARLLVPRAMPVPVTMTVCLIAVALAVLAVSSVSPDLAARLYPCLLYPSDAADDTPCVDLGGRRIIKKKIERHTYH